VAAVKDRKIDKVRAKVRFFHVYGDETFTRHKRKVSRPIECGIWPTGMPGYGVVREFFGPCRAESSPRFFRINV